MRIRCRRTKNVTEEEIYGNIHTDSKRRIMYLEQTVLFFSLITSGSQLVILKEGCLTVDETIYHIVTIQTNSTSLDREHAAPPQICMEKDLSKNTTCFENCTTSDDTVNLYTLTCLTGGIFGSYERRFYVKFDGNVYPMFKGRSDTATDDFMMYCEKDKYLDISDVRITSRTKEFQVTYKLEASTIETMVNLDVYAHDDQNIAQIGTCKQKIAHMNCTLPFLKSCHDYRICINGTFQKDFTGDEIVHQEKCFPATTSISPPHSIQYEFETNSKQIRIFWQNDNACEMKYEDLFTLYNISNARGITFDNTTTNSSILVQNKYLPLKFSVENCVGSAHNECSLYASMDIIKRGNGNNKDTSSVKKIMLSVCACVAAIVVLVILFLLYRKFQRPGYTICRQQNPYIQTMDM